MPLARPRLTEVFFQANLVDGYGYLDARGSLVGQFAPEFQTWTELDENGSTLHFNDPVDQNGPVVELKVGHQLIWVHFREETDGVTIREESSRIVDRACAITNVRRLGKVSPASMSVVVEASRFKALVQIQPVERVRARVRITGQNVIASASTSEVEEPLYGVLLDVDVYDEKPSDSRDPKPHLNRSLTYLNEQVVPFVASLLEQ